MLRLNLLQKNNYKKYIR